MASTDDEVAALLRRILLLQRQEDELLRAIRNRVVSRLTAPAAFTMAATAGAVLGLTGTGPKYRAETATTDTHPVLRALLIAAQLSGPLVNLMAGHASRCAADVRGSQSVTRQGT